MHSVEVAYVIRLGVSRLSGLLVSHLAGTSVQSREDDHIGCRGRVVGKTGFPGRRSYAAP